MFSARPYDGIVPVPYGREGIEVRMVLPGQPRREGRDQGRGVRPGHRQAHRQDAARDASAELRRHRSARRSTTSSATARARARRPRGRRPARSCATVPAAALLRAAGRPDLPLRGRRRVPVLPDRALRLRPRARGALGPDLLPALRPLPALLRLPPAARLVLVDRHLRPEHRNGQPVPPAGRLPALLPDLPAGQAAPFRPAGRVDGRAAGAVEGTASRSSSRRARRCSTCSTRSRPSSSSTT